MSEQLVRYNKAESRQEHSFFLFKATKQHQITQIYIHLQRLFSHVNIFIVTTYQNVYCLCTVVVPLLKSIHVTKYTVVIAIEITFKLFCVSCLLSDLMAVSITSDRRIESGRVLSYLNISIN